MSVPHRVRDWLTRSALPLWSSVGVDADAGGFVERLTFDGTPDLDVAKRVRVQARQIYVFSHAQCLGLMPGAVDVATRGYDFLVRYACPDGIAAGFVHSLERGGAVRNPQRDSYDHAFLLFAFSWYYRASGRSDVRHAIIAVDEAIQTLLRHPNGHGYVIDRSGNDALHQNPHMHMFEAVLAAYDATGDDRFMERAHELFSLFRNHMFDPGAGVLREFYDAQWRPAPGAAGAVVEPGHQSEWIWLLKWYADRIAQPLCAEAYRLRDFVDRHGSAPGHPGLLFDEVTSDGAVRKASTRSWPQTEAIKARIALAEAQRRAPDATTDEMVATLFDTFIDRPIAGGWTDWIDTDGAAMVDYIPASTFYHLFLSLSEYLRSRAA